jgi:hypothetical protein
VPTAEICQSQTYSANKHPQLYQDHYYFVALGLCRLSSRNSYWSFGMRSVTAWIKNYKSSLVQSSRKETDTGICSQ